MTLPFGVDLKSFILGMLFVWFVLPWIMRLVNRPTQSKTANAM